MKGGKRMAQELSAKERIKEAFITMLETPELKPDDAARLVRVGTVLDAHLKAYCSFYDPAQLADLVSSLPPFYTNLLVRPTDYDRIPVSALAAAAGVNRTTFYKFFPNVSALYDACCEDAAALFLAVPLPKEKTPDAMFRYGSELWRLAEENNPRIFTLSHRVNRKQMPYQIAFRLKQQMEETLTAEERVSFRVQGNLELFPELFSTWFSLIHIENIAPGLYPDRGLPVYRPEHSLIDNIALLFADRYGGAADFYLSLGGAALKLLSEKHYETVSVSEFCKTAGYPRSSFYAQFSNLSDYEMKVFENSVLTCVSAFLFFLDHPNAFTPEAMKVFRGEVVAFKTEGIRTIFRNGSITYIFSILFAYLIHIFENRLPVPGPEDINRNRSRVAYYVVYAMRVFSMYFIGDISEGELAVRRKELAHIRKMIGLQ